jgi:hypothetical protein
VQILVVNASRLAGSEMVIFTAMVICRPTLNKFVDRYQSVDDQLINTAITFGPR